MPTPSVDVPVSKNLQTRVPNVIDKSTGFVRDPRMRKQIWEYDANERDEIRKAYIKLGPYQPKLDEYKKTKFGRHSRVNLNIHGLQLRNLVHGLNIHLVKMLLFVYHAFSLTSQLGMLGVMYSLKMDFGIGRKLMMEIIVPF